METKQILKSFAAAVCITMILSGCILLSQIQFFPGPASQPGQAYLNYKVSATITFWENGKIVKSIGGIDPLTNLGFNLTFAKLTGSISYNKTTFLLNTTFVSLGNYTIATGAPDASSTKLPNEWIRTSGVLHALVYNGFNITGTFSGLTGTNDTNCMGINYEGAALGFNDLFAYLTFSQVTGITNSFIVVAEIQVQGTTT